MWLSLSLFFVFIVHKMERPQDTVEESVENVSIKDQGPSALSPCKSARGECDIPVVSTEALFKISQDMEGVLDKLMAPRAPIDSIRKHGVEEFHG